MNVIMQGDLIFREIKVNEDKKVIFISVFKDILKITLNIEH